MSKKYRVLISAGGTGGHLFPAQALAKRLLCENESINLLFAAAGLKTNRYFHKNKFPYVEIDSSTPFQGNRLKAFFSIIKGVIQSFKALRDFKPHVVVGFGSFHSFPLLLAATLKRIPIVLCESNAIPGKVNRFFSRRAEVTMIQFCEARKYLSGNLIETTMPLWGEENLQIASVEHARSHFLLNPLLFTILVFGGSQGSVRINQVFIEAAALLKQQGIEFQIIHLTGKNSKVEELKEKYSALGVPAWVEEFEEKMTLAWRAADLAICRSGAGTIAEQITFSVPAIFIPYPYATDDHQRKNAQIVTEEIKGAAYILEADLTPQLLYKMIEDLIASRNQKLDLMQEALRSFNKREQKQDLYSIIEKLCQKNAITS